MRFAHLSDSHLGYRQFGLLERETDFYEVFEKNIDKIIEKDVDFVIHSGDLFEANRPSTEALLAFQKALLRLNKAKIPIYAIAGNHDSILRKGSLPPAVLFKDIGLKLISPDNPAYVEGGVLICGVPYMHSTQDLLLKQRYAQLSKLADKYIKSILVSHQGIDKWMPDGTHEIELNEMPRNFDYYAMGHIHNYIEENFGKGKLVYPGSMEIWRTNESNQNYRDFGKGFVVVDLNDNVPQVERVKIGLPREFYQLKIDYDKFDEMIYKIKEEIQSLENKPMLDLTVYGKDFNSAEVYEIIKNTLGDYVLNLRPRFLLEEDDVDGDEPNGEILDPRRLLKDKVNKKYGKEEISRLSVDLLNNLSVGKIDDAKIISDIFYSQHYYNVEESRSEPNNDLNSENNDLNSENNNLNSENNDLNSENNDLNSENIGSENKLNLDSNDYSADDEYSNENNSNDEIYNDGNAKSKQMSFDDF